jgi:acyl carrier protein
MTPALRPEIDSQALRRGFERRFGMSNRDTALDVLSRVSGVEPKEIRPEMDLTTDLGIDSPKALQLLVDLEDRLSIEISDEDAATMETVGDVLTYVEATG